MQLNLRTARTSRTCDTPDAALGAEHLARTRPTPDAALGAEPLVRTSRTPDAALGAEPLATTRSTPDASLGAENLARRRPTPDAALGAEHLFASARDALVVIDLTSDHIVRWNAAAEHLFGYSEEQALGRNVQMLMPPDVARLHRERIAHYLRSGESDALVGRPPSSVPALNRAGAQLDVELSVAPFDQPGTPRRWAVLAFRDAAWQHRAELAARPSARGDQAASAHAEPMRGDHGSSTHAEPMRGDHGSFTHAEPTRGDHGAAAHAEQMRGDQAASAHAGQTRGDLQLQLRDCQQLLHETTRAVATPASRLHRAAKRLARLLCGGGADQPERVARLAQVVATRAQDLQLTLAQIDTTASIASGAFELRAARVNLVPPVNKLVADARAQSPMHRLKCGAPQGLTARCDADRIVAVLADVIRRAVRRNPRGCWIDVDLRRPLAGLAYLEVRDYGRPLSPRERAALLGANAADRGWFINRHIVERHGGTLTLEFPAEGGMRVGLSLPTRGGRLLGNHRSARPSR
jgi:PAS domain S-box-containing protein